MQCKDRSYGKMYAIGSKMKDIGVDFKLELNEISAYCRTAIKFRHIWYVIEYIFLAKNIKKSSFSYFRYKTIIESVKMSNHG